MDDLGKQMAEFEREAQQRLKHFPVIAASTAENFFKDRFRTQDWTDTTTEPWKKISDKAKRNKGRAILTDTGDLKRSIRIIKSDWSSVQVGTNLPYAEKHNNGFRGIEQVKSHNRKIKKAFGKRIKPKQVVVRSHARKVNMPQRKFIGNSVVLNNKIEREFILELNKI